MDPFMEEALRAAMKLFEEEREKKFEEEREADWKMFRARLEAEREYWLSVIRETCGPEAAEEAERRFKAMLLRRGRGRIRLKPISETGSAR